MLKSFGSSTAIHRTLASPKGWQNPRAQRRPCSDGSLMVAPSMHTAKTQAQLSWPQTLVGNAAAVQQLNAPAMPAICHPKESPSDNLWGEKLPLAWLPTPAQLSAHSTGQSHSKHLQMLQHCTVQPVPVSLQQDSKTFFQTNIQRCHIYSKPLVQKSGVNINISWDNSENPSKGTAKHPVW